MSIEPSIFGVLGFILVFVLIFLRLPIAFAFASVGFLGVWYLAGLSGALSVLSTTAWENITGYIMVSLPLFMLMGQFANHSGIGPDLYKTALRWWGRLPGGLALTTVWGCAAFGAVTGSSTAGVLTFTPIAYQPMLDLGYDKRLASGSIIAGATMGTIIPPSLSFILYGVITDVSIGKLFISGIFPGILEATLYTIVILFLTGLGIQAGPPGPNYSWKDRISSLKNVWGMLTVFLLVIGGLYMGIFTPTEAAAVGAGGTLIILLIRRGFNRRLITSGIRESVRTTSMIFLILIGSMIFARFLALSGLTQVLVDQITQAGMNPYVSLAAALALFLISGCLMPALPMILLFVPLFFPIFVGVLGFDGVWFGVIIVVMTELALITPPIGLNLFAFQGLLKKDISQLQLWQGVIPFVIADIIRVAILIAFPIIALWLPGMMFKF